MSKIDFIFDFTFEYCNAAMVCNISNLAFQKKWHDGPFNVQLYVWGGCVCEWVCRGVWVCVCVCEGGVWGVWGVCVCVCFCWVWRLWDDAIVFLSHGNADSGSLLQSEIQQWKIWQYKLNDN